MLRKKLIVNVTTYAMCLCVCFFKQGLEIFKGRFLKYNKLNQFKRNQLNIPSFMPSTKETT